MRSVARIVLETLVFVVELVAEAVAATVEAHCYWGIAVFLQCHWRLAPLAMLHGLTGHYLRLSGVG